MTLITTSARRLGLLLLLLWLTISLAPPVAGQPVPPTVQDPDARVAPETFAIFPWDRLPGDRAAYAEARECGFNLAGFVLPENLDAVHAAGLKAFVTDPRILIRGGGEDFSDEEIVARAKAVADATKDHPAVFGYHMLDEPKTGLFPLLAKWTAAFGRAAPGKIAFVNLFPEYGARGNDNEHDRYYRKYLTGFIESARPQVLCYDHYALFADGKVREAYFPNLETASAAAREAQIPLWHVVLANAHFHYAEPSAATFHFQAYTSLAYGVRGIGWFTYRGRDRGNYRSSAIDLHGRRTPTWELLRDVNLQLNRLAPMLAAMEHVNVFHHPTAPAGSRGIESSRFLKELKGAGPFVVGEFEGDGRRAVLVVNKNLAASTNYSPITKEPTMFEKVSSLTGESGPWSAENNWLAPGQGMLLLLTPKE